MESRIILEKLINKGGLMGKFAEMYIDDETKSFLFLQECYGHCHTKSMQLFWGMELINEIREFVEKKESIPTNGIDNGQRLGISRRNTP